MTGVMAVRRIAKRFCKMPKTLAHKQSGGIRDRLDFIGAMRSATTVPCLSCNGVSWSVPPITCLLSRARLLAGIPN